MEPNFDIVKKREEVKEYLTQRLPEQQVVEIRQLLSNYFLNKAEEAFENIAEEKGWSAADYQRWVNEHWRK